MQNLASERAAGKSNRLCLIDPRIEESLAAVLNCCARMLYGSIGNPNAREACLPTALVLADGLQAIGLPARAVACALEGRAGRLRFGIGPAWPDARATAWKGHVVCMVDSILVDPTIGQIQRFGAASPTFVAVIADTPGIPDATADLAEGVSVRWQSQGVDNGWSRSAKAHPARRNGAVVRLVAALRSLPPPRKPNPLRAPF